MTKQRIYAYYILRRENHTVSSYICAIPEVTTSVNRMMCRQKSGLLYIERHLSA
ncbi:hypothetical protein O2313_02920 [Bacillus amyloliquefaciens]|uniref:hypothetical protein n=1 Tax=Bacillus amyloliquefaciens TaxID=1390 RepID=UPI000206ED86|nr:hypothetical protein [Bacillus amyloliquefaciens]AEB64736.1 hypothetical protein LL3_03206 [Bacillus amyloliquefaciens LL3]KYC99478.1 hypothetical protein B425_3963 [Bacillus amyloliquefaciens]MCZ4246496.1 hypothetical protein [Bacillus amyloliquefaciens]QBG57576.1 hypothetical protein D2M30_3275 [Bacillus amyloliquefaciens]